MTKSHPHVCFPRWFLAIVLALVAAAQAAVPKAWFKADSITAANGAAVEIWADSSWSGHVAQALPGRAPTFAATAFNGSSSLHFNGTQTMAFTRPVQDDFTIMVVFQTPGGAGNQNNFYSGAALVSGEIPGFVSDFGMSIRDSGRVLAGTGDPDTTLRSGSGFGDGSPHIATFTRTRADGALALIVDRVSRAIGNGGTQSLTAAAQLTIAAHPGATGPFFHGDIAEIIVFDRALEFSEVVVMEEALRGRYTLANGTVPLVPANLTAADKLLAWNESIGAKSYSVFRAAAPAGPFVIIAENLTGTNYTDVTAPAGVSSYYRVVASNGAGSSAPSEIVEGFVLELPENGPVLINEIHYNGLTNTFRTDFVELYNFSSIPADISGWRVSNAIDYIFPVNTVIPPGGYLVIAEDPAAVLALWGTTANGPYSKSLSSAGETIELRNATDAIVTQVTYNTGFPWPCAADGRGASAELMNPMLDPALGSSWRASVNPDSKPTSETATPGARNLQFTLTPPPNIEQVANAPTQPTGGVPITVTAHLSAAGGIADAQLSYQIVAPGNYIPAYLPLPIVNRNIDTTQPRPPNPAFEDPANWTTIPMTHTGGGIYTANIPGQLHRTLVRYRVTATDTRGTSVRAPFADDHSKNFAAFVYDGVPDYQGIPSATLTTLPVYQFLTRKQDYDQCVAYRYEDQLMGNTPAWTYENWDAAMVFDGVVYDHIRFRLHGGNGRYAFSGKRGLRFFFNKGYDFQNRDHDGKLSPTKWSSITAENGWENRGTLTYSLNEMVNFYLWRKIGIPAPRSNWGHFRTITTVAEQPDRYHGDFWGLIMIHEDYDRQFLDSHSLEKGNLYKLTRDGNDAASQLRYQAPNSVSDGSDHRNIAHNMTPDKDQAFVESFVNFQKWATYHALCQAVRHYDYWPTGDNNAAYYFEPDFTDQPTPLGKLWILPNDVDATWGPTWNEGKDRVYDAVFSGSTPLTGLYPAYFNAVREVRDLLFTPDQINPLLDQFAAIIAPFVPADDLRWKNAPPDAGSHNGLQSSAGYVSLANLVADMKKFAWTGGSWPGGGVQPGGQAAFMDQLQLGVANSEGATMPHTPNISFLGPIGFPTNELTFATTPFSDPQGPTDFAASQWRIAEITDPTAPEYDPAKKVKLEWEANFDSGPLTTFSANYTFPGGICKTGRAYRARVRHQDTSGRWSHWSAPVQFIAGAGTDTLPIVISEFLYKPTNPTPAEAAAGFIDGKMFEFVEIRNVGSIPADLGGCKFTKGIGFTFPESHILAGGESTLVVSNLAAFEMRFGVGRRIAGSFTGALDNSGERLLLTTAVETPLVDFTYSDLPPWPVEADSEGKSLVLIDPPSRPDPNIATNWRASTRPGGAPGFDDTATFAAWAATHDVTGPPDADDDADGIPNSLEYALVTDPHAFSPLPAGRLQPITVAEMEENYLTTTFLRRLDATDIMYRVEYSEDFLNWDQSAVRIDITDHYDGTVTETWRAPAAVTAGRGFLRIGIAPP